MLKHLIGRESPLHHERPGFSDLLSLVGELRVPLSAGLFDLEQCVKIALTLLYWSAMPPMAAPEYRSLCTTEAIAYLEYPLSHIEVSLELIETLFYRTQFNGFRLLDGVLKACTPARLQRCFELLEEGYAAGCLSQEAYVHILTGHFRDKHSLLHELILLGDVTKFKLYVEALANLAEQGLLSYQDFMQVFLFENTARFTAAAQAINGPSYAIFQMTLAIFSVTLNPVDHYRLISSREHMPRAPRRHNDKIFHAKGNHLISVQRQVLFNGFSANDKYAVLNECFDPTSHRRLEHWLIPLREVLRSSSLNQAIPRFSPPVSPVGFFRLTPTVDEESMSPEDIAACLPRFLWPSEG